MGTAGGASCAPAVERIVVSACEASAYSSVLNGRFRGGWTTRRYGRPEEGWHAVQMELAQSTHLAAEAPPFAYDVAKAAPLRAVLAGILAALTDWRPA